jgi:hypothetical protein
MTIYGRFGDEVAIVRIGTLADVKSLDKRKPNKQDRDAVDNMSYVVVRQNDGTERLYHQAFMRATGGSVEIGAALDAVCLAAGIARVGALPDQQRPGRYIFATAAGDAWSVTAEALTELGYFSRSPAPLERWLDSGIDRIELDTSESAL